MYTGLQLSERVLSEKGVPMGAEQIWAYAVEKGYDKECGLSGKTPWRTIQAQLYVNIRDKPDSRFAQVSSRPPMFGLKGMTYGQESTIQKKESAKIRERDLHPLLVAYVDGEQRFKGHTKTIYHENSTKTGKNSEKWMHPDLVSVHFPFEDLDKETVELARNYGQSNITLYSFEMKVSVTGSNVREYFFQAVSNSSWANEGYLVAIDYSEEALDQLSRLCPSFGIGAIRLDVSDVHQSEILIPARETEFVDFGIVNDLLEINRDFRNFIKSINDSMKTQRIIKSDYDKVMSDDELEEYKEQKKITQKS